MWLALGGDASLVVGVVTVRVVTVPARRKSRCVGISQSDHQDRGFLNTNTFITPLPQQLSIFGIGIGVPCTNSVILEVLKTLNLLDIPAHRDFRLAGTTLTPDAARPD